VAEAGSVGLGNDVRRCLAPPRLDNGRVVLLVERQVVDPLAAVADVALDAWVVMQG
jgi:hypothetical protein